ncbi:zinc finger protein weckle-like [Aricia agestis]|uniref:zinc finger protein weckle-like n=1 Tax=Aricia agestis TaxID=91739 RepID=UPI001C20BF4F|nr:zinc finger protein weckle-like [Aricia agestis]XP_041974796.1 zinc finger protein weckle-like [Aricia agestis]
MNNILVREFSCRLCLCVDTEKLKPLSLELKRKLKRLFDITVKKDDELPKAICHDCLQQIGSFYLYTIKVDKNQKLLSLHESKTDTFKLNLATNNETKEQIANKEQKQKDEQNGNSTDNKSSKESSPKAVVEKPPAVNSSKKGPNRGTKQTKKAEPPKEEVDPIVIIDGKPAKHGEELDKQISLFYPMECNICHEKNFNFQSLMNHYKDGHGVPGYVACCGKQFHFFYPKKIIEHMAYHLQPNIFMCHSCHENFQTSHDLQQHCSNGGRSNAKIVCQRCPERYPTYRELGVHLLTHRTDELQCDYCGKMLKFKHRKKTINQMEDLMLCSHCVRTLTSIEKQDKDNREKHKGTRDSSTSKRKIRYTEDDVSSTCTDKL